MPFYGGLRQRLIKDSVYNHVRDCLDTIGWFDAGRQHKPIAMRAKPAEFDEEIALNTLVIAPEDLSEDDWEMGSRMAEHTWTFYVDFYAENDAIGQHLVGDVKDILAGRFPTAGATRSRIPVYDYTQATPPIVFYVDIEEPLIDRAHDFPKDYQKFWYACRFFVVDTYGEAG